MTLGSSLPIALLLPLTCGLEFVVNPANLTISLGLNAQMGCRLKGFSGQPTIGWVKDGEELQSAEFMTVHVSEDEFLSNIRLVNVQQTDMGWYWCVATVNGTHTNSKKAFLAVEGLPYITVQPQDSIVFKNTPFNLTCAAIGRPEPTEIVWKMGEVLVEGTGKESPSVLTLKGIDRPTTFTCEARNSKGVAVSRTASVKVKVPPAKPDRVSIANETANNATVSWTVAFDGLSNVLNCTAQVSNLDMADSRSKTNISFERTFSVPPYRYIISGLRPFTTYGIRLMCSNEVGHSEFTEWIYFQTSEAGPEMPERRTTWAPVIIGVLCAALTLISVLLVMYHIRRKEMQFGEAFGPVSNGVGQMVQYRAGRVYNRRGAERIEATFDTLGISDALKQKLEDIFIHERQLELGRTLGRGEFGSVKEAYLKMEDGSCQRLAVKMLKTEINASGDIEEFLREAACMKEFNHPNVIKVIGVSLQSRAHRRLPVPMVLLPFMKHGDLRTYLVLSRLGDQPVDIPAPTLLNFMIDIVKGMEYLSSKNFVHRDLATRNCMLDQDMHVCVADFGLSRKLYSGDYYRQGSTSKLPVKWIALESLADNMYTVHSDVWSFGVTMWEIAARGQTPYPGVENAEIYEYLIRGHRLKQPPDCTDELYKLMHKCWHTDPKLRPSFESLRTSLEGLLQGLSTASETEQHLYMNLREGAGATASNQGRSMACWEMDGQGADNLEALAISETADYRYVTAPLGFMEDGTEETSANESEDPVQDGQLEDEVTINP
ncbi:tyrosine-protein kinase receptor TYRO3 [Stegostoma tigrinum]|uniref:tyrosine-protein kinase receptor TYRO3 n=1 Tax=Stegostoma tigrinum TaxID=3053191 RepID=UPI00286FD698|nr:tyrosine-protein kinase receptor TYRO3 [Stegostoma tigrinum]